MVWEDNEAQNGQDLAAAWSLLHQECPVYVYVYLCIYIYVSLHIYIYNTYTHVCVCHLHRVLGASLKVAGVAHLSYLCKQGFGHFVHGGLRFFECFLNKAVVGLRKSPSCVPALLLAPAGREH